MFLVVPFIKAAVLAIVAEANLRCGFFVQKKIVVPVLAVFLSFGLGYLTLLEFLEI